MHPLKKSLLAVFVVGSTLALAQPQGEVVIRSRDGKTRIGRILSETSKGYLLSGPDGTAVVEFSSITDIRQLAPQAAQAPLAAPSPVAAPPPLPAPEPVRAAVAEVPPPAPERPAPVPVQELARSEPVPEARSRDGFHFGLGAGAMFLPTGLLAQAQAHFDFTFGRPAYRVSANFGTQQLYSSMFVMGSIDNLFQFNVSDLYSFGAGVQVGVAIGPRLYVYLAPVLQPVIIKLGERGQHQLSLTGSIVALSTISYDEYTFAGTPQVFLGYSYLF